MQANSYAMHKILHILLIGLFLRGEAQAQCNPAFTTTISGATAQFRATDSVPAKVHKWYFGDGAQAWGRQVYHTYSSPGTYHVNHIITDSISNCRDSAQQTITISFPVSCSASFVTSRDSSYPNKYHFYSTSGATGGSIQSYNWKVNGNTVSTASSFTSSFTQGLYLICLTIQTTAGCTSSTCDSVRVDSGASCNLSASFIATPSASNPAQISFTPTPSSPAFLYSWKFGDGQVSYIQAPVHTYSSPGVYHVTLFVLDSATRCHDSVSRYISIYTKPKDSCTASFTYTVNPSQSNQLTFTAISNDSIVSQHWLITPCDSLSIHDSTVYTSPNPVHTFSNPGCYQVCLMLVTRTGCIRNYCSTVIVQPDSAMTGNRNNNLVTTYPNPAYGNTVSIRLDLEQPAKVKLSIYNSYGNLLQTIEKTYTTGQNRISIPVDKLRTGIYYIDIQYGNTRKRSIFQKF